MAEIKLKIIDDITSSEIVKFDAYNIPAVDIPYFITYERVESGNSRLEFMFMNNAELKKSYNDDIVKIEYGKNSGKVYLFELKSNAYINCNKLKKIKNHVCVIQSNLRYKNNIETFLEVINKIINSSID